MKQKVLSALTWATKGCSHRRAIDYYAESILSEGAFRSCCYKAKHGDSDAKKCKDGKYNHMGHHSTYVYLQKVTTELFQSLICTLNPFRLCFSANGDVYCYCNTNSKSKYSLTADGRTGNWAGRKIPYGTGHLVLLPVLLKLALCAPCSMLVML